MTIDEAIVGNTALAKDMRAKGMPILASSIKLGIEALKQVKESRFDPSTWTPQILLGETLKKE